MDFGSVFNRFSRLADLPSDEAAKWTYLVHDCIFEVSEMIVIPDADERDCRRITAVTAALAFYRYRKILFARGELSGFKAGDLTVEIDKSSVDEAYGLYCDELRKAGDILKTDDFVFGRTEELCTEI